METDQQENAIIDMVKKICWLSPDASVIEFEDASEIRNILQGNISNHRKTQRLFLPMMEALSFQGIGDAVVLRYQQAHGSISFHDILKAICRQRRKCHFLCEKLSSFETFKGCGYQKSQPKCNNLGGLFDCPLPTHDLLKGVLNVKAYSFYLYIRDVCRGDMISHFDRIIQAHWKDDRSGTGDAKEAVIKDFTRIFGVGDKLANMTLSVVLAADPDNQPWVSVGQSMVAVDSLVHNFLHRSGILKFYNRCHPYGPRCSKDCLWVLDRIIHQIDAREFNQSYPKYFPRFIQYSIWRFCTLEVHAICNGVNINDANPCQRDDICPVYDLCQHIPLKPKQEDQDETLDSGTA